jgi:hypothetical protein
LNKLTQISSTFFGSTPKEYFFISVALEKENIYLDLKKWEKYLRE